MDPFLPPTSPSLSAGAALCFLPHPDVGLPSAVGEGLLSSEALRGEPGGTRLSCECLLTGPTATGSKTHFYLGLESGKA